LIADVIITNPGAYAEYQEKVPEIVAKYGGKYLVRAGAKHSMEGEIGVDRIVIVEFETLEVAQQFYGSAEYAPLLKLRKETTQTHLAFFVGSAAA
jgi:uncharacterized protein (DUF1330 family)